MQGQSECKIQNRSLHMHAECEKGMNFEMKKKKIKIIVLLLLIILIIGIYAKNSAKPTEYRTFKVMKSDIETIIDGSGTISASESRKEYAKVSAEISDIYFKEGDVVKAGDVIMRLDSESFKNSIKSQNIAIEQSKLSKKSIEKQISDLNIIANSSGYVNGLAISEGSYLTTSAPVCDVVKNGAYEVVLQFVYNENLPINVGDNVVVTLLSSYAKVDGKVTKVSDMRKAITGNVQVRDVTIEVQTTGYSLSGTSAKGQIANGITNLESVNTGTFSMVKLNTIRAKSTGTVAKLLVSEGSFVNQGDLVAVLENSDLATSLENMNLSIQNQYNQLSISNDQLENYEVISDIDGMITSLPFKVGDVVPQGTLLTTISNKDKMEFKIPVDELDVAKLSYDQKVEVSIDAIPETEYEPIAGRIALIPLEGTTTAGITDYYVTIEITDTDNIRISMSANADIIINRCENVLCLPIDAVTSEDRKTFVDILTRNEDGTTNIETREIKVGASDSTYYEVISGVSEGEEIIIPTTNSLYMPSMSSMRERNGDTI